MILFANSMRIINVICVCVLLSVGTSLHAVDKIELFSRVEVSRAQVYVADIASSNMDQLTWANIASIPIQRLAGVGPYTISARRVLSILRSKGIQGEVQIRGLAKVSRKMEIVKADRLFIAARDDMLRRIAETHKWRDVEITQKRIGQELSVYAQENKPADLRAEPLTQNMFGEVPYRICAIDNKQEVARTLVVLEVRVRREVAVVQRDLPKGYVLDYGDLSTESILVDARKQQDAPTIDDIVGKVLRQKMDRGAVVFARDIRAPYAVQGGQAVDIMYERSGFQLTIRGLAQGTAAVGEQVKVRGVNGGKMIVARVIAKDLVKIE